MYLQRKETIYDIVWSDKNDKQLTYGDLYLQNEQEMSHFNFTYADVPSMTDRFSKVEHQIDELIQVGLPIGLRVYARGIPHLQFIRRKKSDFCNRKTKLYS